MTNIVPDPAPVAVSSSVPPALTDHDSGKRIALGVTAGATVSVAPPFEKRDLSGKDFRTYAQSLSKANFSGCLLVGCDFSGLDLSGANFEGADLTEARFVDANLTGATLRHANLTRAVLRGAILEASGIEDVHLPGADLSGAKAGSAQARLEKRLDLAKSLADDLRSVFIAECGLFVYIGATIISASDALVLTNTTTMDLPIVDAKVSVHAFFQLASILILALGTYVLARVSHFARIVSRLPGHLPEGPPLREQVDPWVLSCVGILQRGAPVVSEGRPSIRPIFELFGARIPGLIVRWMGPVVLWYLVLRFFFACQPQLAAWKANLGFGLLVAMFLGSLTVAFGLRSYSEFVDGVQPPTRPSTYAWGAVAAIGVAVGFRLVVQALNWHGAPGETLSGAQLAGANLSHWNFATANLDKANLASANLSSARFQEAVLSDVDLRRAKLDGATFTAANLKGSNLAMSAGTRPSFLHADLTGCDLRHATLPNAILQAAHLTGANLKSFSARQAIGAYADFADTVLDDADLSFALLNSANFQGGKPGTTLFRAILRGADLSSSDFEDVQMFGANLAGANLTAATLTNARVSQTNLSGTLLRRTHFNVAEAWGIDLSSARIDDVHITGKGSSINMATARFKEAHLSNVSFSNVALWGADFENAILDDVDFGDANLGKARFANARLSKVRLAHAVFDRSVLSPEQLGGTDLSTPKQGEQP
jgi:uncharacterized protein YjbI with pentapeptide repeats